MRRLALALALSAASAGAQSPMPGGGSPSAVIPPEMLPPSRAREPAPSAPKPRSSPAKQQPVVRGTVLEEVAGKVVDVDLRAHRLRIETASGPVTLSLDRNTMVYTSTGLGTVLDLVPGAPVRAGRNADLLAYWVQVRAVPQGLPPDRAAAPARGLSPSAGEGARAPAAAGGAPGTPVPAGPAGAAATAGGSPP